MAKIYEMDKWRKRIDAKKDAASCDTPDNALGEDISIEEERRICVEKLKEISEEYDIYEIDENSLIDHHSFGVPDNTFCNIDEEIEHLQEIREMFGKLEKLMQNESEIDQALASVTHETNDAKNIMENIGRRILDSRYMDAIPIFLKKIEKEFHREDFEDICKEMTDYFTSHVLHISPLSSSRFFTAILGLSYPQWDEKWNACLKKSMMMCSLYHRELQTPLVEVIQHFGLNNKNNEIYTTEQERGDDEESMEQAILNFLQKYNLQNEN